MYSIDKYNTFQYVEELRQVILESKDVDAADAPPIVLMGNKVGMISQTHHNNNNG